MMKKIHKKKKTKTVMRNWKYNGKVHQYLDFVIYVRNHFHKIGLRKVVFYYFVYLWGQIRIRWKLLKNYSFLPSIHFPNLPCPFFRVTRLLEPVTANEKPYCKCFKMTVKIWKQFLKSADCRFEENIGSKRNKSTNWKKVYWTLN